ncbi:serine/threonine-protein kinase Vhs1p [Monosporozyma unispora]|nr:hypothetical protein C6P44_002317 [Kazachstania unispora]
MLENCQVNNYRILEQLGSGGYGLVFHVKDILSNKDFAMKIIVKSFLNQPSHNHGKHSENAINIQYKMIKDEILHYFRLNQYKLSLPAVDLNSIKDLSNDELLTMPRYKEISLHLKVHSHKNIVTIHNVMECSFGTFIIMDYYSIDLFNSIVSERHFINNGWLIKKVFLQICSAIEYCHSKGIYHCDIKPENLLLDGNDNVYLCDFGLATRSEMLTPNVSIGSSFYMAPERVLYFKPECSNSTIDDFEEVSKFRTYNADIWSLGILLINLTCIRNPWLKAHQVEDTTFRYYLKDNSVLKRILPISEDLYQILVHVLQLNPNLRCDISSLMIMIRDCPSFHRLDVDGDGNNDALVIVPPLSENEFNRFVAVNELNDNILDMDYLFDSLRNNTVNALGENSLKNTTNNIRAPSNMSSVVSTSNNSTTNDDESTLYATTENLNKETNDDSRFDISTVNTLFNSSNNLTQIYNSNTTSR